MTMDLAARRKFFSEEVQACANLRTPSLVNALATVPREQFLPPGPWLVRGEGDAQGARPTVDADPKHVYHNVAIAIDPDRQLFNGGPTVVASAIDALGVCAGSRVLHVGAGLGYYTAILAHVVGPAGHVTAFEIDSALAERAAANLSGLSNVEVRHGDASDPGGGAFDAMLISAGVTHPPDAWLDALAPGGRMALPLTAAMPAMGPIGKGVLLLVTATGGDEFAVKVLTMVAIYSAIGLRDAALDAELGQSLMRAYSVRDLRLRRDSHDRTQACWYHGRGFCFSVPSRATAA